MGPWKSVPITNPPSLTIFVGHGRTQPIVDPQESRDEAPHHLIQPMADPQGKVYLPQTHSNNNVDLVRYLC